MTVTQWLLTLYNVINKGSAIVWNAKKLLLEEQYMDVPVSIGHDTWRFLTGMVNI